MAKVLKDFSQLYPATIRKRNINDMIELKNISKVYGKKNNAFTALSGINLQLDERKTIAIVGKSGSGKSTLLHLLGGLDRPSEGEIRIHDLNLSSLKRKDIDRYRSHTLGFVFQSFFVEANQTCYQNVSLPLEINRVPTNQRRAIIEDALRQVELFDKLKVKARTLSGGQKQRLAIARAIVNKPEIILADEPTGNLDSATGDKIMDMLFTLHERNKTTLIVVTHDPDIAARCEVRVYLKDGHIEHLEGIKQGGKR